MTTCYDDNLLYIHIPKCGGSSVGGMLKSSKDATQRVGMVHEEWKPGYLHKVCPDIRRDGLLIGHVPACMIEAWTGRPLSSWEVKFATIRNPYSQQYSLWQFHKQRAQGKLAQAKQMGIDPAMAMQDPADEAAYTSQTLLQFVMHPGSNAITRNTVVRVDPTTEGGYYRWWLVHLGVNRVNVLRMETMAETIPKFLGADPSIEMPRHNVLQSSQDEWKNHIDRRTREAIKNKFAWAFACHYDDAI